MPWFLVHPLWFIVKKFTDLPAPVQGGIVSALISTSIAFVVFLIGYVHTTRPILIFVRRPDNYWRIYNIGRGAAFDIRFEDRAEKEMQFKRIMIYPIAEKDKVELGPLDYGEELTLYYSTRSGWRRYKTSCREWENHFTKIRSKFFFWREPLPNWGKIPDETRLIRTPPEFGVLFQQGQPDCHSVPLDFHALSPHGVPMKVGSADAYYVRARIKNIGNMGAEDVEVSVLAVRRKSTTGTFGLVPMGTPWNLAWAHSQTQALPHVLPRLPVSSQRHIDIGHVVDPPKRSSIPGEDRPGSDPTRTLFCLAFFVKSNTYEYLLDPGEYEIDFQIFSANARASEIFTVCLNHTGTWFADEAQMFSPRGLSLRITKR